MRSDPTYQRTRIAPTPSGYLHAGNVLSFVLTAGLARTFGSSILLRIDDLDIGRVRQAYVVDIFDTLSFLGIPWDEGPVDADDLRRQWSQRQRVDEYAEMLRTLQERGCVFACDCTRSRLSGGDFCACAGRSLDMMEPGHTWRLLTNTHNRIDHLDLYRGPVASDFPSSVQQAVVRKRDGDPAYHVASLSDDLQFGVDLIVRGVDLFDSTLLQCRMAEWMSADAFSRVTFFHHPLLSDPSGRKLSKSAGDGSVSDLRKNGASRRDIFQGIAATLGVKESPDHWKDLFDIVSETMGITRDA
ncbi:MAG: glutamate--tRNA ligase family protein [Chitinophagaceae bacterium]|jgi:glutamyl/glutaminyl-tRNA synthetase|nr:glutamate--tRNA ligase family protein [Chitinophagaceae bacterium]